MAPYDDEEDELDQQQEEEQQDEEEEERAPESQPKQKIKLTVQLERDSCTVAVNTSTPFQKIFKAASERFNKKQGALRFLFEGRRLREQETPKMLEMTDGDIIDAQLEQLGG